MTLSGQCGLLPTKPGGEFRSWAMAANCAVDQGSGYPSRSHIQRAARRPERTTPMAADADMPIPDSPVPPPEGARAPRIWVVSGYRAGENTQVSALAERLGCAWLRKDLEFNSLAGPIGLARMVSRSGLESERSSILAPPWPDLVISAGLKNEPVCRWIKRQSGGRTRLVFLGRVWAPRRRFRSHRDDAAIPSAATRQCVAQSVYPTSGDHRTSCHRARPLAGAIRPTAVAKDRCPGRR